MRSTTAAAVSQRITRQRWSIVSGTEAAAMPSTMALPPMRTKSIKMPPDEHHQFAHQIRFARTPSKDLSQSKGRKDQEEYAADLA